jgi:hypothetical protein
MSTISRCAAARALEVPLPTFLGWCQPPGSGLLRPFLNDRGAWRFDLDELRLAGVVARLRAEHQIRADAARVAVERLRATPPQERDALVASGLALIHLGGSCWVAAFPSEIAPGTRPKRAIAISAVWATVLDGEAQARVAASISADPHVGGCAA